MKIVHVLAPAYAGGLERVVHALAIGQLRRGHQVAIIPTVDEWRNDHPFAIPLARAGVEVRPLVVRPRAYLEERRLLGKYLADLAPDVMHSHGYHTDVVAHGPARQAGIATVSTAHGYTSGTWRNRLYEYADRFVLRRFDAVVAVSRPLATVLRSSGINADRLHVVPNAWSQIAAPLARAAARRELGLSLESFVIGWVGRMSHEKGLDVLVDALTMLRDLPLTACVIGSGPEQAPQQARAAAAGVNDRIHWAGLVQEAARYFQALDVLVLSSRTEGVPMVVLESMAARVPLVVTAVGGVPDVVSSQEAILVPSERPDELAAAIRSVFSDRIAAAHRAERGRAKLDREFAEEAWLQAYDNVYAMAIMA